MATKWFFQKEHISPLRKEISSALWYKFSIFLFYTSKNTIRSNKFIWAYLFVHVLFSIIYFAYSGIYSILPIEVSGFFIIYIIVSDAFLKYYMPGQFVEYILPLIRISLSNTLVSTFVIFNVIFYYTNIVLLFSLFLGASFISATLLLTSLILNHIIVLMFKMIPVYKEEWVMVFFVFLLAILNIVGILFEPNLVTAIVLLIVILFVIRKFLIFYLYVKI